VFSLGLVPYMTFQLLLRVFYALHDSRTPCLIGLVTMMTTIVANVIALHTLPASQVDEGLAAGFGIANLVGSIVAWRLLIRRVGSLDGRAITRSLVKMHIAAIPAAMFAIEMIFTVGVIIHQGTLFGLVTLVIGGGGGLLLYVLIARSLRVAEVTQLMATVGARFGGGRGAPSSPRPAPRPRRGPPPGRGPR
jgi:putative peptidoglycan lipid II flippase